MTGDQRPRGDETVARYAPQQVDVAEGVNSLRDEAETMTRYAASVHDLLNTLEDRLFDPVPREVAKANQGPPLQMSLSQSVGATKTLVAQAEDRLHVILSRL